MAFFQYGIKIVIITKGANGSVLATNDGQLIEVRAYNVKEVVDETGAGDCYLGYLIAAQLEGWSWKKSMNFASVAAGLKVGRVGTTNIPLRGEVEKSLGIFKHQG